LVDTLEPATMAHHRPLWLVQRLAQRVQLGRQQRASAGDLGELGHAMGGALGAVRGAKGVHHEDIAQRRVLLRQFIGVLLLTLVEAHVLQQHQLARLDLDAAQVVLDQRHLTTERLAQVVGDRLEAVFLAVDALFRAAQVRADHHRGALLQRQLDGRQRSENARVALHHAILHRHVEILPDQHALAGEVEVGHLQNGHVDLP